MSRECDSHDCHTHGHSHHVPGGHECDEDPCYRGSGSRSARNEYLSDSFGAYQGYWLRQSEYWYDLVGRFVCGEYRVDQYGKDVARFWDDWMADYQRLVQFPHRKANKDRTPNVVFTLDARAEGSLTQEVALTFNIGRRRPRLVATPLCCIQDGSPAVGTHIQAKLDDRGYYAKIQLVDAGKLPREELHYLSVVHAEGSREPIAVVHVVRRGETAQVEVPQETVGQPRVATVGAATSSGEELKTIVTTLQSLSRELSALNDRFTLLEQSVAAKSRGTTPEPSSSDRSG